MNITRGKVAKAQKVVIYGPEGIGKSTLAAQFPDPIFIDTEGSTGNMDVARLDKPSSWTFLSQQVEFVKNNQPCKTLVIDTIDWAERMAIEHLCQSNQKKSIEDFGYGSGYIKLEEDIGRFLNLLSDVIEVGINVVLTAHAQIRKFEQPDEMGAYDRYELKLGKKTSARTSSLVKEWADMVLFINYKTYSVATDDKGKKHKGQGGARTVYATHHPAWDAKNRHGLPDEFPLDYANIAHIFNSTQQTKQHVQQPDQQQPISNTFDKDRYFYHPESDSYTMFSKGQSIPNDIDFAHCQEISKEEYEVGISKIQSLQQEHQKVPEPSVSINAAIPQSLRDLMQQDGVSEEEIQVVVSNKGYYPMGTPIVNYDPGFVEGVLVGAWPQVFGMIQEFRKNLPFS